MQLINRPNCILTGINDLEHIHTFSHFPAIVGPTKDSAEKDLFADMNWHISKNTGCIQITNAVPPEVMYATDHTVGGASPLWMEHHRAFAAFLADFSPASILEIGGGQGMLSVEFQTHKHIPWTIVEPNANPLAGCTAKYISVFFDENFNTDFTYDTVVFSHLLEHIFEPKRFLETIHDKMPENATLVFSFPNMRRMLEEKHLNCLHFEHPNYITETALDTLLHNTDYSIVKKSYFKNHSVFYAAQKMDCAKTAKSPFVNEYARNKNDFLSFVAEYAAFTQKTNVEIKRRDCPPVFVFGAGFFASYLMAFGLDMSRITAILDNAPNKQNRRFYGSHLMIQSPACLQDYSEALIILRAGFMNQEIKDVILSEINSKVTFLE